MKLRNYSRWKFHFVLGIGAVLALLLCAQCVRTYLYTDAVLIPQQAELEAERQVGTVNAAVRSAGVTDPRALGPVIEHAMESASDRVLWMRILDLNSTVLAQGGRPQGVAKIPPQWWERVEKHEGLGTLVSTPEGKALVVDLPLRMPHPLSAQSEHNASGNHPGAYILELAIPLKAVASAFDGLRQDLILGLIAAITLLVSVAVIGLCAPRYLRGKHLDSEMQLAKRVQADLQPKASPISSAVEFSALSVAADHVGGDFYDIFETECGKVTIVLGDVSGKGIPAALLVSVLHGAIRSANASQHELACERINRMLCERTAGERFVTLFWGVFDPETRLLRYVNAGHAAPVFLRRGRLQTEPLDQGGPVLGVLPDLHYAPGTVTIEDGDTLVLYSDGMSEASDENDQEFGEARIQEIVAETLSDRPVDVCSRIMTQVNAFATSAGPVDDRTLLAVKFPGPRTSALQTKSTQLAMASVA